MALSQPLAMFGITMAGYGHSPQTCCQIGHKYQQSFKSIQYKTEHLDRKENLLGTLHFKVVSCSILCWIMRVEQIKQTKDSLF